MNGLIGITMAAALVFTPAAVKAESTCDNIASLAASVMEAHQSAVPLSEVMKMIGNKEHAAAKELATEMAMSAYSETRWHTEYSKMRSVSDFRDKWHMACLKSSM